MPADPRPSTGVDVYAMPAAIGGGLGDIVEVLEAARWVERSGTPVVVFRRKDRPLPIGVSRLWPAGRRVGRPVALHHKAVTISAQFGVTAEQERPGPLGRPGPWAPEVDAIEATYGAEATLHVSLEEFARTLSSAQQVDERYREAGVRAGDPRRSVGRTARRAEVAYARAAYRRFRCFDRPNLLTLYPTFVRSSAFAREFPEAVQTGPLRPCRPPLKRVRPPGPPRILWYPSPTSAGRLLPGLARGVDGAPLGVELRVRFSGPLMFPADFPAKVVQVPPQGDQGWRREWTRARLAIVTGSRSLLEALHDRVPFLYYNGVLGSGTRTRRHRPEKIQGLLRLLQIAGAPRELRDDLDRFSRARSVAAVVRRAIAGPTRRFPVRAWSSGFPSPYRSAERVVVDVVRRFGRTDASAPKLVDAVRRESRVGPFSRL